MPYSGTGTYNLPSGNPVSTGTTISSTWANSTLSDVATALTNCVTRDGQSPATANLPMGSHKITGLAAGTQAGDAARYEQVTSSVAITGGSIDGVAIGATVPSTVSATVITGTTIAASTGFLGSGSGIVGTASGLSIGGNAATANSATSASSSTTATTATNLASGSAGTIPYQSASGTTAMVPVGTSGQLLTSSGAAAPVWQDRIQSTALSGGVAATASISTTTLTVTAVATGTLQPGQLIYASGISAGTRIVNQLTSTGSSAATTSAIPSGVSGTSTLILNSISDISSGYFITGTGIASGTTVSSVDSSANKLTLSANFSSTGSGSYLIYNNSAAATPTAITSGVSGTATLLLSSVSFVSSGQYVAGTGVGAGVTVSAVNSSINSVTLSGNLSTTGSGTYTFHNSTASATITATAGGTGTTTITLPNVTGLTVNALISGTNIQAGTLVSSIDAINNQIVISKATSGSVAGVSLSFYAAVGAATLVATGSSGTNTFVVSDASAVIVGQRVSGTGVPTDSTVTNKSGNTITISSNLSSQVSGTYSFYDLKATRTLVTSGTSGTYSVTVSSVTGLVAGQLITGTGLASGTLISSISGYVLTLSNAFSTQASGTYTVYTPGGVGTYTVNVSQTFASGSIGVSGFYFAVPSWAKRVRLALGELSPASTAANSAPNIVFNGVSGTYKGIATRVSGAPTNLNHSTYFGLIGATTNTNSATAYNGEILFSRLIDAATGLYTGYWSMASNLGDSYSAGYSCVAGGSVSWSSGTLTGLTLSTIAGTNNAMAGFITAYFE